MYYELLRIIEYTSKSHKKSNKLPRKFCNKKVPTMKMLKYQLKIVSEDENYLNKNMVEQSRE